jgi:DNA phosphorothioation-dependent restriction protein DptH
VSPLPDVLLGEIGWRLAERLSRAVVGHCLRLDELTGDDAYRLMSALDELNVSDSTIAVLSTESGRPHMTVEEAIGVRNDKNTRLLLLVPTGLGHTASSLDNSFEKVELVALLSTAGDALEARLLGSQFAAPLRELKQRLGRNRPTESWARFLAQLVEDDDEQCFGRNLWIVGLIPDLGSLDDVQSRLARNGSAVSAIARPSRPTASVDERLAAVDVRRGTIRDQLVDFLAMQRPLPQVQAWARRLGDEHGGRLTFECWPLADVVLASILEVRLKGFRRDDGSLDPACKLRETADGTLVCGVSPERPGVVVVQWTTDPTRTEAVAAWRLEVVPPEDLRSDDIEPVSSARAPGARRRSSVRVDISEDDLVGGSLFVVRLRALDHNGSDLFLSDGRPAVVDSEPFQVVFVDQQPDKATRRTSAPSIAEAILHATVRGARSTSQDLPMWDLDGQVFGIRIDGRSVVQLRVSAMLVRLQRRLMADPLVHAFRAESRFGEALTIDDVEGLDLGLGGAFASHRRRMLDEMRARAPRDVGEVLVWDDPLRELVRTYVQSYRRALDSSDRETQSRLQRSDTLEISAKTSTGVRRGIVVLPTHPLRLAWIAAHDQLLGNWAEELIEEGESAVKRSQRIDLRLVARLAPANLPFSMVDELGELQTYFEELTHGSALFMSPDRMEPEQDADALCAAIGLPRDSPSLRASSDLLASRFASFRNARPGLTSIRIMVVNPGGGELVARGLLPIVLPSASEGDEVMGTQPPRVEVVAYSEAPPFASPLPRLRHLQARLLTAQTPGRKSHLTPPLGLAMRRHESLVSDDEAHHLAVLQDLSRGEGRATEEFANSRSTAFRDLLTPLVTVREEQEGRVRWRTGPALKSRGTSLAADVVEAHRVHQLAVGGVLGGAGSVTIDVALRPDDLAMIRAAHERSDWVLTIDRFVGLDLYDQPLASGLGSENFILDYAPDFIEGLTHRVTVTTAHRGEVLRLLSQAMGNLGLAAVDTSVSAVLNRLLIVSGRLALRLIDDSGMAREAVSLAALMAHLERLGELDELIVVPVDAHPEIFGSAAREGEDSARRCDLLLVRVTARSFKIDCIEVKSRKDAALPVALADRIVDQLEDTRSLLLSRFFATDPPRLDGALQRARLAGLLHYYADRAASNDLILPDRMADMHRNIDRIDEQAERADINMRGYVVSLTGESGFPQRHRGVPITVLTAEDLGRAGFTTMIEEQERAGVAVGAVAGLEQNRPPHGMTQARSRSSARGRSSADRSGNGNHGAAEPEADVHAERSSAAPSPGAADSRQTAANATRQSNDIEIVIGQDVAAGDVGWTVSTKGSPHAFVVGIPGQGKSVTTRRIIRGFSEHGLPSLIFDFHGDMAAEPPHGAAVLDATDGLPFSPFEPASDAQGQLNMAAWEIAEIVAYVAGLGEIQRNTVYKSLQKAYAVCMDESGSLTRLPTMAEFADAVERAEENARGGRNTRARISPLTDFGLFRDDAPAGFDPRRGGMVIDVSGLQLETVQLAAAAFLLRKVYRDMFRWGQDGTMRLAVVLDEAHRLAKDVTLPKLMKEGRKYGIAVVVASQGMADFHRDVVGNAGTKIVFRTNFPASKTVAGFLRGRSGQDLSQQIEQLGVGQAYVSTAEHAHARRVFMAT